MAPILTESLPAAQPPAREHILSKGRLEALSDAVFAVVMTLLVLEIKPEHLPSGATDAEIWSSIRQLARPLSVYAFTFALTGVFWVMQHRKLMLLTHTTIRHAYLTLAFLFAVSLLPLTISLWVPHPGRPPGLILYYSNFALISVTLLAGWIDARLTGLVSGAPETLRRATIRFTAIAAGATGGAVLVWFEPNLAAVAVLVAVVGGRVYGKFGQPS